MLIAGFALAVLAAFIHVYIFFMESLAWEGPRARATFGEADAEELRMTKELAYNQGFYNLFLALLAIIGTVVAAIGHGPIGATLALAGTGCMLAAALVLLLSSREHTAAALKQGAVPLLAVVALVVGLLM